MFDEVTQLLLDTINGEFSRDNEKKRTRKIIFWYDPKEEYRELINELNRENTEIIVYDNNSCWIRYHIEKEELTKNIQELISNKIYDFNCIDTSEITDMSNLFGDIVNNINKITNIQPYRNVRSM